MTRTVLVVDDQPDFLEHAQRLLSRSSDFRVVGLADSGPQALALLPRLKPDVALVDVFMPGMNGFEVTQRLLEVEPGLRVVISSLFGMPQYETMARTIGAAGFINKKDFSAESVARILDRPRGGRGPAGIQGPGTDSGTQP